MPVAIRKSGEKFRLDKRLAFATLAVFAITFMLGQLGLSVARPVFIVGCLGLGWWAVQLAPTQHIAITVVMFAFAPFLRRVVDRTCGFDDSAIMLAAPLVAMLPAIFTVFRPGWPVIKAGGLAPYIIAGLCGAYAVLVAAFGGQVLATLPLAIKWDAPLVYGIFVLRTTREGHDVLGAMAAAFLVTMPIVGIYGISQYLDPPEWDRVWMLFSKMESIGNPAPYEVRVFSTLNSPASCATYLVAGITLLWLRREMWLTAIIAMPMAVTLLVSLYRTAWISLAAEIILFAAFRATRKRTLVIVACLAATAIVAVGAGQFGDAITNRFSTLSDGSNDGSARVRMSEYATVYAHADGLAVGMGAIDLRMPNTFGLLDGTIIQLLVTMGLFVGPICLLALLWPSVRGLLDNGNYYNPTETAVVRALVLGELLQMPMGNVTNGEMGFLFWLVIGIAAGGPEKRAFAPDGSVARLPSPHYTVTPVNQVPT